MCVDDLSEADVGCAHASEEFDQTADGLIVGVGAAGYVPCDAVPELLAKQVAPPPPDATIVLPNVCYVDGKAFSEGAGHDGQVCRLNRGERLRCRWDP